VFFADPGGGEENTGADSSLGIPFSPSSQGRTKLQEVYVGAGYLLARVVVAPQELGERARVKIQVIDGFVERIDVTALPTAVAGRVAAVLEPLFRKRRLLQRELERRLLLAGDTPGLDLRSTFAAGEEIGGAVLILTGRYRPVTAGAYADNAMPKTFGTTQVLALFGLNSVLGLGEQITVIGHRLAQVQFWNRVPDPPLSARKRRGSARNRWMAIAGYDDRRENDPQCRSGSCDAGRVQAKQCRPRLRRRQNS
jgi:POTRA domain, ShlB-type